MKSNLEYANDLIRKAEDLVRKAEEEIKKTSLSYSNIISCCQMAIELSGEAIFKIVGLEYPKDHQLLLKKRTKETKYIGIKDEVRNLLKRGFPESFNKERIPRVLFLTHFWHNFYTLAKYGIEELNFPPDKLFTKEDTKLALRHAKECTFVADDLLYFERIEEVK